ncbi:MAG TPA: phosphate ABC transporter substrate-binding protein [Candidatus Merdenecus merdavium]|nr:phosphate ABC transporter substrate-binding protein [Candidatus Merdenecus merdavium]
MKKLATLLMAGILSVGLIGCGTSSDNESGSTQPSSEEVQTSSKEAETSSKDTEPSSEDAEASNEDAESTIVITGSTSVEKILNDMKEEFMALNPGVNIEYVGSGSSAGIADTKAGTNNIGTLSREIKDEEKEDALKSEVFAYDGIAMIVNPSNTAVEDLSTEQLVKIYSGEITNWSEVGGEDAEIFVVSREESSGTRSAFEELIGLQDAGGLTEKAAVSEGNGPVQAAVAGNENAIGYVSFSFIDDTVKAVKVDGVEGNAELAKEGTYPLSRPFIFCYYDDKVTELGKEFIEFALSEDGQVSVEDHGGIPIN